MTFVFHVALAEESKPVVEILLFLSSDIFCCGFNTFYFTIYWDNGAFFLSIFDFSIVLSDIAMRHTSIITIYLAYFSALVVASNPCTTTDKPVCSDNIGDNCTPGGWNPGQIICCTVNGYVYCDDTNTMQYAACPNNGFCRTDFKTCTQQCHSS
jgi:hypothetical protein